MLVNVSSPSDSSPVRIIILLSSYTSETFSFCPQLSLLLSSAGNSLLGPSGPKVTATLCGPFAKVSLPLCGFLLAEPRNAHASNRYVYLQSICDSFLLRRRIAGKYSLMGLVRNGEFFFFINFKTFLLARTLCLEEVKIQMSMFGTDQQESYWKW